MQQRPCAKQASLTLCYWYCQSHPSKRTFQSQSVNNNNYVNKIMQFHCENSGFHLNRRQTNAALNVTKTSSVAVQATDCSANFVADLSAAPIGEVKEQYRKALDFLNRCHDFMNSIFEEQRLQTSHKEFDFRAPKMPNYFSVLEMFTNQFKSHSTATTSQLGLKMFLPVRNMGDGPSHFKGKLRADGDCNTCNPEGDRITIECEETAMNIVDGLPTFPPRLVKSDRDIHRNLSQQEVKAISTTFEKILKTCNQFENKSIEYLLTNDIPLNEPPEFPKSFRVEDDKFVLGNGERPERVTETNNNGFNLMEYALKNCKPIFEEQEPSYFPSFLMDIQDIVANANKPLAVLNQPLQCQSPKRVNEMFKNISKESLRRSSDSDDSDDSEELRTYIVEDEQMCESSSGDSIIWNDEEFQRRMVDQTVRRARGKEGISKSACLIKIEPETPAKSNPLELSEKDRSFTNEKILRSIGLFTESGDIRPDVIGIVEEKRRMSVSQNQTKNVKFRTERKFDLEVCFNSMKLSNIASEESLKGRTTKLSRNVSSSSSSTISESDICVNKDI